MNPDLMAALIERARIEDAIEAHMQKYPDWWREENSCMTGEDRPANVEWTRLVIAKSLNEMDLSRLAREVAAAASTRAA